MAEPVGLASGVLALTTFAIQSTKALFEVVKSFQNRVRAVRELRQELEALEQVLLSLQEIQNDPQIDLSALELPLLRCGEACTGFAEFIKKYTARSDKSTISFRDWVMLTYRGRDIGGFRNLIGAYKSTIAIALADANIRHVNVTVQLLRQYKEMIENTTTDLQDILQQSAEVPGSGSQEGELVGTNGLDAAELLAMKEERAGIEHCLNVCAQVSNHIEQVKAEILGPPGVQPPEHETAESQRRSSSARSITSEKLEDCKTGIGITAAELRLRLRDVNHRLTRLLNHPNSDQNAVENGSRMHETVEELKSIKQCLTICERATDEVTRERIHVFEDVHMLDDAQQVIVATLGDLISARHITTGARSRQWLGQMSDDSLQQLSRDNATIAIATGVVNTAETKKSPSSNPEDDAPLDPASNEPRLTIYRQFQARHGTGRTLG